MKAVITMSFDTAKKTMMGVSPYELVKFINKRKNKPLAIGANCGIGPPELLISMKEIKDNLSNEILLVAKGNCGIPKYKNGEDIDYNSNSDLSSYSIYEDNPIYEDLFGYLYNFLHLVILDL